MDFQEVKRTMERIERAKAEARRFDLRLEEANKRIDRWVEEQRASYERAMERWEAGFARYQKRIDDQVRDFERATADLDRYQLNRVNRVVSDFDAGHETTPKSLSLWGLFLAVIAGRRRTDPFEEYLRRAHEHPAIARRNGGTRSWFREWRKYALLVLEAGLAPRRFVEVMRSTSPPRRRPGRLRASRPGSVVPHDFRERLLHVIEPHGPTAGSLPRHRALEAGLLA
jgi:hypothetical protein